MRLLHNIGDIRHSNYHTRDQILKSNEPLGFDGIYLNVYENKDILKEKTGVFFVMGNYIGGDNYFDLKFSLEEILKREIDLLEEKSIRNPYFLEAVNHQKQLIYG